LCQALHLRAILASLFGVDYKPAGQTGARRWQCRGA
jgi:hypothetical protein